jgi:hypothetical protein
MECRWPATWAIVRPPSPPFLGSAGQRVPAVKGRDVHRPAPRYGKNRPNPAARSSRDGRGTGDNDHDALRATLGRRKSVTIATLHQSFAVSVSAFATGWAKDGREAQIGGATMAKRKEPGLLERLRQSFHRFWNECPEA